MKTFNYYCFCIFLFLLSACSSSNTGTSTTETSTPISLENRLRQTPGIFFQGSQVRMRGGDQSFFSDSEPLFVINGQAISGGYAAVVNLVNAAEIKSVRALRNPTDLAMYGVRGSNGVVIIRLKNSKGNGS